MAKKLSYYKTWGRWWRCDQTPCDIVTPFPHKVMTSQAAARLNKRPPALAAKKGGK